MQGTLDMFVSEGAGDQRAVLQVHSSSGAYNTNAGLQPHSLNRKRKINQTDSIVSEHLAYSSGPQSKLPNVQVCLVASSC